MDGWSDPPPPQLYKVKAGEQGWQVWREDVWLATYPSEDRALAVAQEMARRFGGPVIVDGQQGA